MGYFLSRAALGAALLVAFISGTDADATSYFPALNTDKKEDYINWVNVHSSLYARHTFMASDGKGEEGAAVFWNIDGDTVHFAVAVRAEGWVSFGISEAGGMAGSDLALYQASNPLELVDAYIIEDRSTPLRDDCQDWTLNDTMVENGWMIVEMSRLLNTKDGQDHAIKNDTDLWAAPTRFIAAWGDHDSVSYHGQKKSRSSVRLFANHSNDLTEMQVLLETLEEGSDGYFDFVEDDFDVPPVETYYHDSCRTFEEFNIDLPEGQSMITMIGAVPILDEETAQFVHHFAVYLQRDCSEESFFTRTMVYAWAPGDEGWALPDDIGFPVFDNVDNQAVFLQIHYDNPSLIEGAKDSSGLRFYYTNDERTHQAGIIEVGDPWISLYGESIDKGHTKYSFTCPGSCSSSILGKERNSGDQGVTIMSEFLHMHQAGVRMTNEVIRGKEVIHTAVSDVFDFNQQGEMSATWSITHLICTFHFSRR